MHNQLEIPPAPEQQRAPNYIVLDLDDMLTMHRIMQPYEAPDPARERQAYAASLIIAQGPAVTGIDDAHLHQPVSVAQPPAIEAIRYL